MAANQDAMPRPDSDLRIDADPKFWRRLVLRIGTEQFGCNLDPDLADSQDGELPAGVRTLDCWIAELQQLAGEGAPLMLPFDFSDECTAWLQVTPPREGLVEVQAGWSLVGQYDLDFSDFIAVGRSLSDFKPVPGARIERTLADFIAMVMAARTFVADHFQSDRMKNERAQVLALMRAGRLKDAAIRVGVMNPDTLD